MELNRKRNSDYWQKVRRRAALKLFHRAAKQVPAYQDFLKRHKIKPETIKTYEQFLGLPAVDKNNYLSRYDLATFNAGGLNQPLTFTATSGSTGEPFYFTRNKELERAAALWHEYYLKNNPQSVAGPTLVIVAFGMGIWIGGVITYQSFKTAAGRGYPLSIVTPGINKAEILKLLKKVAPHYRQTILCGYAPFVKDVIDEARAARINLKKLNLRFLFAAEAFTEKFRDYLGAKAGAKNKLLDTANIYGSAELGTMALETPVCILIRRLAVKNPRLFKALFGSIKQTPTLAQFNPEVIDFNERDGRLLASGASAMPLIRYDIGDHGGVLTFARIEKIFKDRKIDLRLKVKLAGIGQTVMELPFVYVYERADLATKLYGAIIYPEYVKLSLAYPQLQKYVTGKFTLLTKYDEKQNEYLEVNVELKPKTTESEWLAQTVAEAIHKSLMERSAEYKNNADMMGERVKPKTVFWPHEHPTHFKPGIKQKWVKKL